MWGSLHGGATASADRAFLRGNDDPWTPNASFATTKARRLNRPCYKRTRIAAYSIQVAYCLANSDCSGGPSAESARRGAAPHPDSTIVQGRTASTYE